MRFCLCCFALLLACAKAGAAPLSNPQQRAVHVLNRLSFGIQPGDVARVSAIGVDAYIDAQLHPERIPLPEALTRQLNQLDLINTPISDLIAQMQDMKQATPSDNNNNTRRDLGKHLYRQAATARMLNALQSPRQLEEVMVDFWFNHFNVFDGKGMDKILIAAYERDAIRPHVLGHFGELLRATAKHPAMLFYLDNWLSVAPLTSLPHAGSKQRSTGLNENYARELMELHTLGVEGGYTQQDVTELARILTGWSFKPQTGAFAFLPQRHDTGTKIWLGQRIDSQGMAEGEYALDMLAKSPRVSRILCKRGLV